MSKIIAKLDLKWDQSKVFKRNVEKYNCNRVIEQTTEDQNKELFDAEMLKSILFWHCRNHDGVFPFERQALSSRSINNVTWTLNGDIEVGER